MKRYRIPLGFLALASVSLLSLAATAAEPAPGPVCGDHGAIKDALSKSYSEKPVAMGLASNGAVVEIFASQTGTFTIIMTEPTGRSCMLTAGESWESIPRQLTDLQI